MDQCRVAWELSFHLVGLMLSQAVAPDVAAHSLLMKSCELDENPTTGPGGAVPEVGISASGRHFQPLEAQAGASQIVCRGYSSPRHLWLRGRQRG